MSVCGGEEGSGTNVMGGVGEGWSHCSEDYVISRLFQNSYKYLPILYVDRLKVTTKHLEVYKAMLTLDLSYSPPA